MVRTMSLDKVQLCNEQLQMQTVFVKTVTLKDELLLAESNCSVLIDVFVLVK